MGTMVTVKQLKSMQNYFLKTLFYGIPAIPCRFATRDEMGGADGVFHMEENEEYEPDEEIMNAPEHKSRYHGRNGIGYTYDPHPAYLDPLCHPFLSISIAARLKKDPLKVTAILLHELCHYFCYYTGLDYSDGQRDFENMLKELGLPNDFDDYIWNKQDGCWEDSFEYERARGYYEEWLKAYKEKAA